MDTLLFHPKIVHLPIALMLLMPLITGILLLAWQAGWLPRRTWWLAIGLQALLVGSSALAMNTGEAEEERVEPLVPEAALEAHEEAAEVFAWATLLPLLLLGGAGLIPSERWAKGVALGGVVSSVLILGLGYRVGEAGGALVYSHNAGAAYASGSPALTGQHAQAPNGDEDEDEDD